MRRMNFKKNNYKRTMNKLIFIVFFCILINSLMIYHFYNKYTSDKVVISKKFYDTNATAEEQQNSLIFYENIYMPNTGVLYTSDEEFDVVSVLPGTVRNIKEDEIMGNIVEVEYNQNLTIIYQGLKDVVVTINQELNKGDLIAKSGNIKFTSEPNTLHIEVYKDGLLLNPLDFYNMKTTDFS